MRRVLCLLAALAALGGCTGEEEDEELPPGSVARIGVVSAPGSRALLVRRGVRVAAASINTAGGIGGAATIDLVVGPVERLLAGGLHLVVLPCDPERAAAAARALSRDATVAVAPCDDGLPAFARVFPTGLSPRAHAELLAEHVDEPASLLSPTTARGRLVERLLRQRVELIASRPTAGTDAPERVLPPPEVPDGVLFVTYGFPEPGGETDEFYERYKALFGHRPLSIVAALGADALQVLADAIELAGTTDPEPVAAVLRDDGLEVSGVLGRIEFPGGTTRPTKVPAVVLRVEGGRYRVVDRDG